MFRDNPVRRRQADAPRSGNTAALPVTIPLEEVDETMGPLVGGKAVNLGRLLGLGFSVPAGFCVTTHACRLAVPAGAIEAIVEQLGEVRSDNQERLKELARAIREAILSAPIPTPVVAAVSGGYDGLGGGFIAVRSSATAEDLPTASFAGQLDSELNVNGLEEALGAVRRCWASLWSDRAVVYRAERGIEQRAVGIAVVVQKMVAARVAGVIFTANPLTGRRRESVVEAVPGLGEALVSGAVTPDHYVVVSDDETVVEQRWADRGGACLQADELRQIVRLGASISERFGAPQDVEWAIDQGGSAWILQARPITTLFPLPSGAPQSSDELRVYYSLNASQGMERPFTPLGESIFRLLVSSIVTIFGFPPKDASAGPSFLSEAGGRLYVDLTAALRSRIGRRIVLSMVGAVQERAEAALEGIAADPTFSIISSSPLPFLRRALAFLLRSGLAPALAAALLHPRGVRRRVERVRGLIEAEARSTVAGASQERLAAVERLLSPANIRPLLTVMPSVLLPLRVLLAAARRLLRGLAGEEEIDACLRALPNNPTTEMDLELWALACVAGGEGGLRSRLLATRSEAISKDYHAGRLSARFTEGFASFLRRHGHRCANELDAGLPRWSENPAPLFGLIATYLRRGSSTTPPDEQFRSAAVRSEAGIASLAARAAGGRRAGRGGSILDSLRGRLVSLTLSRARSLAGLQEAPRSLIALLFAGARSLLAPLGATLVERGILESAEDLSFLALPEIAAALRGERVAAEVRERKAVYLREVARRGHAILLLSDGTVLDGGALAAEGDGKGQNSAAHTPGGPSILTGIPASSGTVRGTARVIFDPEEARLAPGEILVAPSTDPGWTPLFLIASGLVMESGGPMSHGAIVAREYGIPAVVGVAGATKLIHDGQTLFLDAGKGTVVVQ